MNIANVFLSSLNQVWHTLSVNWIYLLISAVIAVLIKRHADPDHVASFLRRYSRFGVVAATLAAVGTPLCSCGTTAVVLGMLAGMMPWAPVVAFMIASPLTSPQELIYSAGLFGWPFALAFFGASILLGLAGGLAAAFFEKRGWFKNQARLPMMEIRPNELLDTREPESPICTCEVKSTPIPVFDSPTVMYTNQAAGASDCCSIPIQRPIAPTISAPGLRETFSDFCYTGVRLLMMFFVFAFVGYFLNGLIPHTWIKGVFGSRNVYSVPLAATLGLPLYVNTEASLPLVRAMLDAGMSQGAALAFLITGAGTSFGALAGALTIARWRILAVVTGTLWLGGMACGFVWNILAAMFA